MLSALIDIHQKTCFFILFFFHASVNSSLISSISYRYNIKNTLRSLTCDILFFKQLYVYTKRLPFSGMATSTHVSHDVAMVTHHVMVSANTKMNSIVLQVKQRKKIKTFTKKQKSEENE